MKDPQIDIADNTYTRYTTDIQERRAWGRLQGYTSNTVGNHYLRLTMTQPREKTERHWRSVEINFGRSETETVVGIRLHAGQVKQLKRFLEKWLKCHYNHSQPCAPLPSSRPCARLSPRTDRNP